MLICILDRTNTWMCYTVFPYLLASHSVAGVPAESLVAYCSVKQSTSSSCSHSLPHHLTSDSLLSRITQNAVSNESHRSTCLTPSTSPLFSFLHLLPCLPGAMVICPLRGGESVTCRLAPSSYDTRWHSTAVIASNESGSGDQIISHPASISHILMCRTENRSHTIRMKPTKWPTSPVCHFHNMSVRERIRWDLVDSKVLALGSKFDGLWSKVKNAACQARTSLSWKPCCLGC